LACKINKLFRQKRIPKKIHPHELANVKGCLFAVRYGAWGILMAKSLSLQVVEPELEQPLLR
jgi:hypothetical protein